MQPQLTKIIEAAIVIRAVDELLASGFEIAVVTENDQVIEPQTTSRANIIKAVEKTEHRFKLRIHLSEKYLGTLSCEWGGGLDVILAYSRHVDREMKTVNAFKYMLESKYFTFIFADHVVTGANKNKQIGYIYGSLQELDKQISGLLIQTSKIGALK